VVEDGIEKADIVAAVKERMSKNVVDIINGKDFDVSAVIEEVILDMLG